MAYLILADGTVFEGVSVGVEGMVVGEVVFNTSHLGYQEMLTDPSYAGQILALTTPHVGNVGVNIADNESAKVHASGAVFADFSDYYSNWRAEKSLGDFFRQQNVVAISDIDTRALTLVLREVGFQNGCIVTNNAILPEQALAFANSHQPLNVKNLTESVSCMSAYLYADPQNSKGHIVLIDCGTKQAILRALAELPVKITVVPQAITFEELNHLKPDGVLLSNGPGDPMACMGVISLAKKLLQSKMPVFGICLGHQILALAAGAQTKKMKFGHHGANHPIQCHQSGSIFISSQNHGFVVDDMNLPACLAVTHTSLFDGTIAGLKHLEVPAFSFQGHPEAAPGPNEFLPLFAQFIYEVCHAKKH